MKKTIIALFALAGVSMGVETLLTLDSDKLALSTVSVNGSNVITSGNQALTFSVDGSTTLNSYIFTFGYDSLSGGNQDSWLRMGGGSGYGIGTNTNNTMVLKSAIGTADTIADTQLTYNTTDTFALTVGGGKVYLANLTTGDYVSTSITEESNWSIVSGTTRIYTNYAKNHIQVGQIADLSGLTAAQVQEVATKGTYSIPEPTTATLSLLALAGLAARRRRK